MQCVWGVLYLLWSWSQGLQDNKGLLSLRHPWLWFSTTHAAYLVLGIVVPHPQGCPSKGVGADMSVSRPSQGWDQHPTSTLNLGECATLSPLPTSWLEPDPPEPLLPGRVPELQLHSQPRLQLHELHMEVHPHGLVDGV